MSASDARVKRVHAATRVFFERLCPGEGDVYARRLRSRFVAPAFAFESKPHMTEELGLSHANALLLSLIPGIALWLVGLNPQVYAAIQRSPLGAKLGTERMMFDLEIAVDRYRKRQAGGA